MPHRAFRSLSLVAPLALGAVLLGLAGAGSTAAAPSPGEAIRVDQLGYTPAETKIGYVISTSALGGARFSVLDASGKAVLHGAVGASRGRWNARYRAVQPLDFSALRVAGSYRIRLDAAGVLSPPFRVASAKALFLPRVADTVSFFQAQRDGSDVVPGPLQRKPSHLRDRHALVYAVPRYESSDSDVILGASLERIGGPVDVEGGWMDAGDFIKFTHTTAYADVLLLEALRRLGPAAPRTLAPETRHGLDWLAKAWDPKTGVMIAQVGIGFGNKAGTFAGDHDLWRLPQRDDHLKGAANRYVRDRPVFRANAPGTPLPPNIAGRVAAAFALAAQVDAARNPARARGELATAAQVFAAAKTGSVKPADVVTAFPHAFYPESSWRDDLELAGAELALAGQALHDARAQSWLSASAHWARAYLADEAGHDTLNLYDTSALAHADLIRAMRAAGRPSLEVGESRLLADLRAQIGIGLSRATRDPFRASAIYDDFDAASHSFSLVTTALLYHELTGSARYDAFATATRDWALGANAWGVSLMVGVGSRFPHCMQHVVANLSGSTNGGPPIDRGAVVNGPNDSTLFEGGLGSFFGEAKACPAKKGDPFARFTGHESRFVDDVRSWQTVEPALDMTGSATLAFALLS